MIRLYFFYFGLICCLHFLPLTATYSLLLFLTVWLLKHGVTHGALLDITVIGCTLADCVGELADSFPAIFPFSQDKARCTGHRGLFGTKENSVV